jgi:hypothetical protein
MALSFPKRRAFDAGRDLRDGSQGLCARPQRLVRSGGLRLLGPRRRRRQGVTAVAESEHDCGW